MRNTKKFKPGGDQTVISTIAQEVTVKNHEAFEHAKPLIQKSYEAF
jgi:hypothetical protein